MSDLQYGTCNIILLRCPLGFTGLKRFLANLANFGHKDFPYKKL